MKYVMGFMAMAGALSCAGCWFLGAGYKATPIPEAGVAQLTTCKTGDLSQIKKNLVLSGYAVDRADPDILQTGYKQLDGGRYSKSFEKISVVRVDDHTSKFTVKLRVDSKEEVENEKLKNSHGETIATGTRVENTSDEADMSYYEEERAIHEARRKRVCGDGA